jgi:hypothetical protein
MAVTQRATRENTYVVKPERMAYRSAIGGVVLTTKPKHAEPPRITENFIIASSGQVYEVQQQPLSIARYVDA